MALTTENGGQENARSMSFGGRESGHRDIATIADSRTDQTLSLFCLRVLRVSVLYGDRKSVV